MHASAARSTIYSRFAQAFSFPEAAMEDALLSGQVDLELRSSAQQLPYMCMLNRGEPRGAEQRVSSDSLTVLYTSKFEVGNPPVSLHEGSYSSQDHKKLMENAFRFYEYFGLNFENQELGNTPDWLISELEFMHYLGFLESRVNDEAKQAALQLAQYDFIRSHLQWLDRLVEKLHDQDVEVYSHFGSLLNEFVEADKIYLAELTNKANQ